MSKCKGCGVTLQNTDETKVGYTPKKDSKLCQRCFKITNYNEHIQIIDKIDNNEIIEGINKKCASTMFLCDLLNLNKNVIDLYNKINEPKCLVITKSDIIPKNIKLDILAENIMKVYSVKDLFFVSSLSGFGKKDILEYIKENKKVIFAGPTSSGKSSLINYLFNLSLTVSNRKNTTQEFISIKTEEGTVIDAPGFNEEYLDDLVKQTGYINPKTMLLKKGFVLKVGKMKINAKEDVNVTVFVPKDVKFVTMKLKTKLISEMNVNTQSDLIIDNIGFIYFKNPAVLSYQTDGYVDIRPSVIGGAHE